MNKGPRIQKRIIGGSVADIREHPWLLSLREKNLHKCGASLITPDKALTAAHCYKISLSAHNYTVYAGSTYRRINGELVQVERIFIHPDFNYDDFVNDIAVVWLSRALSLSEFIQPVALAQKDEILPDGSAGIIAGWGVTYPSNRFYSEDLYETILPIITNDVCKNVYGGTVNDDVICAGTLNGGQDTLRGDSGMINSNHSVQYYLA